MQEKIEINENCMAIKIDDLWFVVDNGNIWPEVSKRILSVDKDLFTAITIAFKNMHDFAHTLENTLMGFAKILSKQNYLEGDGLELKRHDNGFECIEKEENSENYYVICGTYFTCENS